MLVRISIGEISELAIKATNFCVKSIRKLLNPKIVLLCNKKPSFDTNNFDLVLDQNQFSHSLSIPPPQKYNPAWKLYPPRLDINTYELFLDNDLILNSLPKELKFDNSIVVSEAYERCYGIYETNLKCSINTGFLCLPPGLDFKSELEKHIVNDWQTHCDEQGLVAKVLEDKEFNLISNKDIAVWVKETEFGKVGNHFIGLNKGNNFFWKKFLKNKYQL